MKRMLFLLFPLTLLLACGSANDPLALSGSGNEDEDSGSSYASDYVMDDEGDNIDLVSFDRTISITFSTSGSATVSGDTNGIVKVSGNDVTADNTATGEKVYYKLSGTTSDGFFKLYSANKQAVELNGADITNKRGSAINIQGSKRTFVVVTGTNKLADGASYTLTPSDEDEKAAFFSEGQLVFSGKGSLTVTATGKAGITSDDYVRFLAAPTVKVSSTAGHGVRGKDAVVVTDGTLGITVSAAGKKGICSDGPGYFNGGTVVVNVSGSNTGSSSGNGGPGGFGGWGGWGGSSSSSDDSSAAKAIKFDGNLVFAGSDVTAIAKNHEAIESKGTLEITGGRVYALSADDAINAASHLTISDGYVCAYSTGNDGLDANGNMYITGGVIYAVSAGGAEVALDANTEGGNRLYISGGTLFALGGLENGAQLTQNCYSASWSKNTWYSLTVGDKTYAFKTPSSGGNGLVVSAASKPELKSGVSVSGGESIFSGMGLIAPTVSGGSDVSLSGYSASTGRRGGPGEFMRMEMW